MTCPRYPLCPLCKKEYSISVQAMLHNVVDLKDRTLYIHTKCQGRVTYEEILNYNGVMTSEDTVLW